MVSTPDTGGLSQCAWQQLKEETLVYSGIESPLQSIYTAEDSDALQFAWDDGSIGDISTGQYTDRTV